jgi:hypothetical protein
MDPRICICLDLLPLLLPLLLPSPLLVLWFVIPQGSAFASCLHLFFHPLEPLLAARHP